MREGHDRISQSGYLDCKKQKRRWINYGRENRTRTTGNPRSNKGTSTEERAERKKRKMSERREGRKREERRRRDNT